MIEEVILQRVAFASDARIVKLAEAELHQFVSQWIGKNHLSRKEAIEALRIQSKLVACVANVLEALEEPKRLEYQK